MSLQNVKATKSAGRPRSFDEDEALEQAMCVFWEKGFEGASLIHLSKAMKLKPASIYGAFGNKEQLFRKVLDRYLREHVQFIADAVNQPTAYKVAEHLLRGTADFLSREGFPPGCLTIQTAIAASDEGATIHGELNGVRIAPLKNLQERFKRAQHDGDLPADMNSDSLAQFVVTVYQGMTIQSVNGASHKEMLDVADTALLVWPERSRG